MCQTMPAERRLYDRLGVPRNASPEDIKRAYKSVPQTSFVTEELLMLFIISRRLALKHHPDRGGDAKAFQEPD